MEHDAVAFGVNPAGIPGHQKYAGQMSFNFPLLSDASREVASRYGALKADGKGIERTVYLVDKQGRIRFAQRGMPELADVLASL